MGRDELGHRSETVRRANLSAIIKALHSGGPRSRSDLVTRTGLTRSAIRALTGELVAGDLATEGLGWGYEQGVLIFGGLIALTTLGYYLGTLPAVPAFWIAYILTRPLGASLGDLLSQAPDYGGLGLSSFWINAVFFATILALIAYLTGSGADQPNAETAARLSDRAAVAD